MSWSRSSVGRGDPSAVRRERRSPFGPKRARLLHSELGIGSLAEFAVVPEHVAALKPSRLDFVQAASVPMVGLTSWQALKERAGLRAGLDGERSGLWSEIARLCGELRPRVLIVENVAALLGRGISRVVGDLAALGFDAEWDCVPASAVGAKAGDSDTGTSTTETIDLGGNIGFVDENPSVTVVATDSASVRVTTQDANTDTLPSGTNRSWLW